MSTYVKQLYPEIYSSTSYLGNSKWFSEESKDKKWSQEENKKFENALALFDKDSPDRWYNVAAMIPGKTVNDVIKQYRELEEDVSDIEAGLIPVPGYARDSFTLELMNHQGYDGMNQFYVTCGKRSTSTRPSDQERKKGVPWTEDEHRQFLLGLKKYGKGDWRNISRNFVTSRTPTQVASHAQKYFIRQLSGGKDKRRSSIHDITTVNLVNAKSTSTDSDQQHLDVNGRHKQLYGWNLSNKGSVMDFNQPSQLTTTHPETSSHGLGMQDYNLQRGILQRPQFGYYDSVSQMQQRTTYDHINLLGTMF
ncbi:Transcription factor DIVARICATA [Heracleum sosnowskyi]|uniref:Transcription factor DIVARICATA n=1 Tax=Heracleum sosnowskyi TaxID=360622 RepID=A0AAD8MLQ4_9APIA|nr:Transcription factor DIVARICATA [Heracleum sosnowskyi]